MSKSPIVSILVAVRNEEAVIERLLLSIENLAYSPDKFEVILGNDHSSDRTDSILNEYAQKHQNWKVETLTDDPNSVLKGKSRVLNILAKEAKGDFLFFTDADISLPSNWIEGMLSYFDSNVGVVVGTTSMEDNSFLAIMQSLEWISVLNFNKIMSDWGIETTGMGNNMAVSRIAYNAVGGYDKIGFSIVEDYALYKAIINAGFGFKQTFTEDSHSLTLPPDNFLEQRTRWISGAIKSKSKFVIPAVLQSLSLPIYIILLFVSWKAALTIWLTFMVFNLYVIANSNKKLGLTNSIFWSPVFCFYVPISWGIQISYYILKQGKVSWKGRSY
ncbi:Glycosyl transferase family 2 [Spirosomataceae bacterium TFI 002]|nr:Glycosyl transferase family 2 [Spirosomataceae bacterium TFI 002]